MGNELTRDQLDALGEEYFRLDPPYRLERVLQMAYALGQQNADEGLRRDAERYRDLGALVAFGSWGVCSCDVVDKWGNTNAVYMDDKEHMDSELDKAHDDAAMLHKLHAQSDAALEPKP